MTGMGLVMILPWDDSWFTPSPYRIGWEYFGVLCLSWAFSRVVVFLDDDAQATESEDAATASLLGLGAYFAVSALGRIVDRSAVYGLDTPNDHLSIIFRVSWFLWFLILSAHFVASARHYEGLLRIGFILSGRGKPATTARTARRVEARAQAAYDEAERREAALARKVSGMDSDLQEFFAYLHEFEKVPSDLNEFRGFIGEAARRFEERQRQKTIQVTRERIEEVAKLYRAYADVQRHKGELARAYASLRRVPKDIEIDAMSQQFELERIETDRARLATVRVRAERDREALEDARRRELPARLDLPLIVGETTGQNSVPRDIGLDSELRRRHVYIVGQTQSGKTTLMQNMFRQDMEHGHGCAFIDPHGDAAQELLDYIPESRIEDVVYLDFTLSDPVVAFNPLAVPRDQRHAHVEDFVSFFDKQFGTDADSAPRMHAILRNSLAILLGSSKQRTVVDLERFLVDEAFRKATAMQTGDVDLVQLWRDHLVGLKRNEVQPILTRLSAVLSPGSQLRAILSQSENRIDFDGIINRGKVLLVRMSKAHGLENATMLLSALLVTRLQQAAMAREALSREKRRPFYLYADEFQNYAVKSFTTILEEVAKYELSITMANQTFHRLPPDIRSSVIGCVGTIVAFRVGAEDANVLHPEMRRRVDRGWFPDAAALTNLQPHSGFVRLGRPETVERITTQRLPPRPKNFAEIRQEAQRWSQRHYYAPRRTENPRSPSSEGDSEFLQ